VEPVAKQRGNHATEIVNFLLSFGGAREGRREQLPPCALAFAPPIWPQEKF